MAEINRRRYHKSRPRVKNKKKHEVQEQAETAEKTGEVCPGLDFSAWYG